MLECGTSALKKMPDNCRCISTGLERKPNAGKSNRITRLELAATKTLNFLIAPNFQTTSARASLLHAIFALPAHSSSVKEGRMNHSRLQPRINEASRILLGRSKSNNQNNGKYKAVLPLTARTVKPFCRGWLLLIGHGMYGKLRMSDRQTCEWPGRNIISICQAFQEPGKPKVSSKCQRQCHCNSQQLHDYNVQASVSGSWFTETATGAEPHTRTGNVHWAERSESKLKVTATNPKSLCHKH